MAGEAPICNGELFKDFGHMANTPASKTVLDGTYIAPQDTDTATCELLAKIPAIRCIIPSYLVVIFITPDQWKAYWKIVNKETLSLESGIYFRHYIVGCKLDIIAH
jgi:hypothetical protein